MMENFEIKMEEDYHEIRTEVKQENHEMKIEEENHEIRTEVKQENHEMKIEEENHEIRTEVKQENHEMKIEEENHEIRTDVKQENHEMKIGEENHEIRTDVKQENHEMKIEEENHEMNTEVKQENHEMKIGEENHDMEPEVKQENEEVKLEEYQEDYQDQEPDRHTLNTRNWTDPAASSGPSGLQVEKMTQKRKAPALRNKDTDKVVDKRLTYDPSGPSTSSTSSQEAESTDLQISETATMMGAAPARLDISSVSAEVHGERSRRASKRRLTPTAFPTVFCYTKEKRKRTLPRNRSPLPPQPHMASEALGSTGADGDGESVTAEESSHPVSTKRKPKRTNQSSCDSTTQCIIKETCDEGVQCEILPRFDGMSVWTGTVSPHEIKRDHCYNRETPRTMPPTAVKSRKPQMCGSPALDTIGLMSSESHEEGDVLIYDPQAEDISYMILESQNSHVCQLKQSILYLDHH